MTEILRTEAEQYEPVNANNVLTSAVGKISVLEALATDIPAFSPNMSNHTSRQGNADYDDA